MANILVVDDELGIRDLLSEILNDEGHSVDLAENATQARAARVSGSYDLVLLDIWMPDTDGISLLKEWATGGLLTMPVIMMSGHATIDTAVDATRIGAFSFLEKPITLQKLLKAVEQGLARHALRTASGAAAPLSGVQGQHADPSSMGQHPSQQTGHHVTARRHDGAAHRRDRYVHRGRAEQQHQTARDGDRPEVRDQVRPARRHRARAPQQVHGGAHAEPSGLHPARDRQERGHLVEPDVGARRAEPRGPVLRQGHEDAGRQRRDFGAWVAERGRRRAHRRLDVARPQTATEQQAAEAQQEPGDRVVSRPRIESHNRHPIRARGADRPARPPKSWHREAGAPRM